LPHSRQSAYDYFSGQGEIHLDFRGDFNGLAADDRRPINPLLDRTDGSRYQERIPIDYVQLFNMTVSPDERCE
jgi:hypothetical protein